MARNSQKLLGLLVDLPLGETLLSAQRVLKAPAKLIRDIQTGESLGAGESGEVFQVGRLAVKVQNPCATENDYTDEFACSELQEGAIVLVIPSDIKKVVELPIALHEGFVGVHLSNIPGFIRTNGTYLDGARSLIVSELAQPSFEYHDETDSYHSQMITSSHLLWIFLFKVIWALSEAQRLYRFTHYDLHMNNILVKRSLNPKRTYEYRGRVYKLPEHQFEVCITDFGYARVETSQYILNARKDYLRSYHRGVYSSVYDIAVLLGPNLLPLLTMEPPLLTGVNYSDLLWECLGIALEDDWSPRLSPAALVSDIRKQLDSHYKDLFPLEATVNTEVPRTASYGTILDYLSSLITGDPFSRTKHSRAASARVYTYPSADTSLDLLVLKRRKGSEGFQILQSEYGGEELTEDEQADFDTDEAPETYADILHDDDLTEETWQESEQRAPGGPVSELILGMEQVLSSLSLPEWLRYSWMYHAIRDGQGAQSLCHIMTVDAEAMQKDGFGFISTFSKIDPITFVERHAGFAINGSYFDIPSSKIPDGTYRPIGWFFNKNSPFSDFQQPQGQADGSGAYVIVSDRDIRIAASAELDRDTQSGFSASPLLVKNGRRVLSDTYADEIVVRNDMKYKKYACENIYTRTEGKVLPSKQDLYNPVSDVHTLNCDRILPGEMYHGAVRNPRSMLCKLPDGTVMFVVVDGVRNVGQERLRTSFGATFDDLIDIAIRLGADSAVNLDGGYSSNMAWNFIRSETCVSSRTETYPVGSILAIRKRR